MPGADRLRTVPGMRCLVEDLATFAATAGAWLRREPVLHNVLLTLVADRLSGDVPLSGAERDAARRGQAVAGSAFSMATRSSSAAGSTVGANRAATVPSGATRNFSKFHRTSPVCPSASGASTSAV